uniref:Uncharacterized protein n=1 Tax=Panagrolaimus superbus TaxID=310955 RepID=A0A914Y7P5_9BILA
MKQIVQAAIIIIILRFVQGIWCCGLIGKKKSKSSEDGPPQSVKIQLQKGFTKSSDEKHRSPSSTVPETAGQESTGQLQQDGDGAKEIIPPVTPPAPPPPPPPPPPPAPLKEKKAEKPVVSRETKDTTGNVTTDEKESDGETDGATTGATTTVAPTTTAAAAEKKKERVPNMLLLATKEEDTQSEGQIPSKRKTKVEKHNKEPAPTKNVTQDPGAPATKGIATGKAAATTMKVVTGVQKTQAAKTGLPKSETDLVTDEKAGTKGVSATQGDKVSLLVKDYCNQSFI